ncbi:MAG TPA: hypothetical protein VKZ99_07870 [Gammaproteobacteria bacterium]|nr:hypothetical protein [Gammaproteobacteria bacterium]
MLEWKSIIYCSGSEWAPDDPWGREVLRVESGGAFEYENRHRGSGKRVEGVINAGQLREIGAHFVVAGYPAVPEHDIPPGASVISFDVEGRGARHRLQMDYYAAKKFPGYRELLLRFERWTQVLREGADGESAGLLRERETPL